MSKIRNRSQRIGDTGEDVFRPWASQILGWTCTKPQHDYGYDYICQHYRYIDNKEKFQGDVVGISVRSCASERGSIRINRSDAELILKSKNPLLITIIKFHKSLDKHSVALVIPDENFIFKLLDFSESDRKSLSFNFSAALSDAEEITSRVERLLSYPYTMWIYKTIIEWFKRKYPSLDDINAGFLLRSNPQLGLFSPGKLPQKFILSIAESKYFSVPIRDYSGAIDESSKLTEYSVGPLDSASSESYFSSKEPNKIRAILDQLEEDLLLWNYNTAFSKAKALEETISSIQTKIEVSAYVNALYMVARTYLLVFEHKINQNQTLIEHANSLIDIVIGKTNSEHDEELIKKAIALRGSFLNLKHGPQAALSLLDERVDPSAVRTSLAIMLNNNELAAAISKIEKVAISVYWIDIAILAYVLAGDIAKAEELMDFPELNSKPVCKSYSALRFAQGLILLIYNEEKGGPLSDMFNLGDKKQSLAKKVPEVLDSIIKKIELKGKIDNGLELQAAILAVQVYWLLQNKPELSKLTSIMSKYRPIPMEVGRAVINGIVYAEHDIPKYLRQDHPNDFDAHMIAVIIQSAFLGDTNEAYKEAKSIRNLADSNEKIVELFRLLMQLRQELKGKDKKDCEIEIRSLAGDDKALLDLLDAAIYLERNDIEKALIIAKEGASTFDPVRNQIIANALLKKGNRREALKYLFQATEIIREPNLLEKTADLAINLEEFEIAVKCTEWLLQIDPVNIKSLNNLAYAFTFVFPDLKRAEEYLRRLSVIEPMESRHRLNLAISLAQQYCPEESLSILEELVRLPQPDLNTVRWQAKIYSGMGDLDNAFRSLYKWFQTFKDSPEFLVDYIKLAFAIGKEKETHDAMDTLILMKEKGDVDPSVIHKLDKDQAFEQLMDFAKEGIKRSSLILSAVLKGHLPWTWAEPNLGFPVYHGWRIRTRELPWISDDPLKRARFVTYSTNGFQAQKSERDVTELLPLEVPVRESRIVADISTLITLHNLELLNITGEFFQEILVPQGYLASVLEDGEQLTLMQYSRTETAKKAEELVRTDRIKIQEESSVSDATVVDEYNEDQGSSYPLIDIIRPIKEAGFLSDLDYKRIKPFSTKGSTIGKDHEELSRFSQIVVGLETLFVLIKTGVVEQVLAFYKTVISAEDFRRCSALISEYEFQESSRKQHFQFWDELKENPKIKFESHMIPENFKNADQYQSDNFAMLGSFMARDKELPLLADDRAVQVMTINEVNLEGPRAFGTDVLIMQLLIEGLIDSLQAAQSLLQLTNWRYKFILIPPEILKIYADQFKEGLPGISLIQVARYVHDCMSDSGLFSGPEKTDQKESMAMRLYLYWIKSIAEFILLIWGDESYSEESAKLVSEWALMELLPSPPLVMNADMMRKISDITPWLILSHALIKTSADPERKRVTDAVQSIRLGLDLPDEDYFKIVTKVLNDSRR